MGMGDQLRPGDVMREDTLIPLICLAAITAGLHYLLKIMDSVREVNKQMRLARAHIEAKWLDEAKGHPHPLRHPTFHIEAPDEQEALQSLVYPARIES